MKNVFFLFLLTAIPLLTGYMLRSVKTDEPGITLVTAAPALLNPEYLDGAFTGGFGEPTCHSCHFDYDLNMDVVSLAISGIAGSFVPGKTYNLTLTVKSDQLANGGFQMTSRFDDGTQAGSFEWQGDHLMLTPGIGGDIQYLQHSTSGTRPSKDHMIEWDFMWNAPQRESGKVTINIAANAGNDDDSSFGDRIIVKEKILHRFQEQQ
jgi:hypothetical protein